MWGFKIKQEVLQIKDKNKVTRKRNKKRPIRKLNTFKS